MTIEEAATLMRVARSTAYAQARLYEQTKGAHGMPVKTIGGVRRVLKSALVAWIEGPPTTATTPPVGQAAAES